jgi:hypothetical protein
MFAAVTLAVVLLAAAGCGSDKKPPATPPAKATGATPAASGASATPSGSPAALIEFTVDGAGPYQLGTTLASLQATKNLDEVATGGQVCPQNTTARGTGTWKDIRLSFRSDGKLYLAVNRSTSIPTPSGAWLGTTLAQLKSIYAGVSGEELAHGAGGGYLVTTLSGRGILFDLDANKKVISMTAGDSAPLKASYLGGTDFC